MTILQDVCYIMNTSKVIIDKKQLNKVDWKDADPKAIPICYAVKKTVMLPMQVMTNPRFTAPKMKFSSISKSNEVFRKLQIWSHLLNKFLMENFIFCAVFVLTISQKIKETRLKFSQGSVTILWRT